MLRNTIKNSNKKLFINFLELMKKVKKYSEFMKLYFHHQKMEK